MAKFAEVDAQVVGISVDHVPCLKAWVKELGGVSYPLLSDFWPHGATAISWGVLRGEGYSERAIFLVDKEGTVRYIDVHDIDDQPDNAVVLAELAKLSKGGAAAQTAAPRQAETAASQAAETASGEEPAPGTPRVTMYCRSWCPDCTRARRWLEAHGIDFEEIDVEDVPEAAEKVKAWNGGKLVTPTCNIDGEIVIDFDVERLQELLGVES